MAEGQARPHCRQRIVEQQSIGDMGAVIAGEPDLVHAIVETDDAVFGHDLPHIVDDALRRRRKPALVGPFADMGENLGAQRQQRRSICELALQAVREKPQAQSDIADELRMREEDFLHIRRQITDMQHDRSLGTHDERRLLHRIVTDGDDQIGAVDRLMNIVALGERRRPHVQVRAAGDGALAHLRVEEGNADAADELRQGVGQPRPVRRGAQHQQRPLGGEDHRCSPVERGGRRNGNVDRVGGHGGKLGHFFGGNVFRQLKMNRARPLLLRHPEGVAHERGDRRRADDLVGHLGQGRHGRNDVDDLEACLFSADDPLLAGDHHHRHGTEQGIGGASGQVQGARPERRQANARLARQSAIGRGHEGGRLFVPGQHELDFRLPQGLDDIEVLFPGNAEDPFNALVFQGSYQKIGAFRHGGQTLFVKSVAA